MVAGRREDRLVFDAQTAVAQQLRLPVHADRARVRAAHAPLLLGGEGGDAAQPDLMLNIEERVNGRGRADAADLPALPRPPACTRWRRDTLFERAARTRSSDLPSSTSTRPASGAVGANCAAPAVQRARSRMRSARSGEPRTCSPDPRRPRPDARLPADEPDQRASGATCGCSAASSARCMQFDLFHATRWTSTS